VVADTSISSPNYQQVQSSFLFAGEHDALDKPLLGELAVSIFDDLVRNCGALHVPELG
jgi:hypothetical protein